MEASQKEKRKNETWKKKTKNERRIERIAIPVKLQRWLNYLVWPFPIRLIILFLNRKIYTVSDNREIPHGYAPSIIYIYFFALPLLASPVVDYFNVCLCICAKRVKSFDDICENMHALTFALKYCPKKNLWKVVVSLSLRPLILIHMACIALM